jgi:hypothetical protein
MFGDGGQNTKREWNIDANEEREGTTALLNAPG